LAALSNELAAVSNNFVGPRCEGRAHRSCHPIASITFFTFCTRRLYAADLFQHPRRVAVHTGASNTGWVSTQNGIVLSRHQKKGKAVATGRRLAKRLATELTVHGRDGKVLQTASYLTPVSPAATP
jgi:Uncharacterized protein conserved in bacteria (DUF2188)